MVSSFEQLIQYFSLGKKCDEKKLLKDLKE